MALKPLSHLPETPLKIKRALLSVSDKSGIVELAKMLHQNGVEILSTGGTANVLRKAKIPVKDVSEVTQFPECLDGRVKTLHPNIHGGILARTSHEPDKQELQELDIKPIELVVVNLYPFKEAIKKEKEQDIDIDMDVKPDKVKINVSIQSEGQATSEEQEEKDLRITNMSRLNPLDKLSQIHQQSPLQSKIGV